MQGRKIRGFKWWTITITKNESPPSCIGGYCMSMSFTPLITPTEYEREVEGKRSRKVQKDESTFQYVCYPLNPCA
jgi:hypothetical protein